MLKKLTSFLLYLTIQAHRVIDHGWRYLTGLPLAKRSLITPNIYLGGQYRLNSLTTLKKLGVTGIVSMRETLINNENSRTKVRSFLASRNKLEDLGVKILHLPTKNTYAPTLEQLDKGAKFIDSEIKKGGKVYIHCWWGEERGPTMAIAYLISTGLTLEDAFKLVKKTRTFINPTPAQVKRLQEFERMRANN